MIKHEFVFNAPKQIVISHLMSGLTEAKSSKTFLDEEDVIYGKVRADRVLLFHGIKYKNSFRPVFTAKIMENGKTVIRGFWRLPNFSTIFILIWFGFLLGFGCLSLFKNFSIQLVWFLLLFSVLGVLIVMLGVFLERKRMKKVIEYIEKKAEYINSNQIV